MSKDLEEEFIWKTVAVDGMLIILCMYVCMYVGGMSDGACWSSRRSLMRR
jgi:hypothetical protein